MLKSNLFYFITSCIASDKQNIKSEKKCYKSVATPVLKAWLFGPGQCVWAKTLDATNIDLTK